MDERWKKNQALLGMLDKQIFLDGIDPNNLKKNPAYAVYEVAYPDADYDFLHEAAIIEYHGVLFASWYNCPKTELHGETPIRGKRSYDGGKTWSDIEVLASDPSGKIIYCPPVYGVCDDTLYLFVNEMVGPDLIHALDLYRYDEVSGKFEFLWSKPSGFKLNTNVYTLPNGKLMLPGRVGVETDGFPQIPVVLISDSGKIDAEWRMVYVQEDKIFPDGGEYVHPEQSAIIDGERVWLFCRDDNRDVPLCYRSDDNGETWSKVMAHDIPFTSSKIYSGTLSNGKNYLIGNIPPTPTAEGEGQNNTRSRLAIFFSEPGTMKFTEGYLLQDGESEELGHGVYWHYPVAHEADGKLYIIYTMSLHPNTSLRGAVLSVVPIE